MTDNTSVGIIRQNSDGKFDVKQQRVVISASPKKRGTGISSAHKRQRGSVDWMPLSSALAWIMCRDDRHMYEFQDHSRKGLAEGLKYLESLGKAGRLAIRDLQAAWMQLQAAAAKQKVRMQADRDNAGVHTIPPPADKTDTAKVFLDEFYDAEPDVCEDVGDLLLFVRDQSLVLRHRNWAKGKDRYYPAVYAWTPDLLTSFPVAQDVKAKPGGKSHHAAVKAIRAIGLENLKKPVSERLKQVNQRLKEMNAPVSDVSDSEVKRAITAIKAETEPTVSS